jgi:hypothetical protein
MLEQKTQFEDRKYFKATLQVVTGLCFLGTGLLGLQTIRANMNMLTTIGLFAGTVFCGAMIILTWLDNLILPRYLTPPVTFIIVIFLVMVGDGVRDEAILGFVLVIALAGLLIGRKWVAFYTVIGALAVTIIGVWQFYGRFASIAHLALPIHRIFIIDIIFVLIGAVTYVTIANLEHVLKQVREREVELEKSNQALLDIQAGLEERVAERVRSLNKAREEAEAARDQLEKQAWQTRGLAQLSDHIRGDQEITELANKVIQHLCTYLDAQVGAIFLLDGEKKLQEIGAYALSSDRPSSFDFGDGLVGQAARGKAVILLTDIPEDAIRITSGLGDLLPRNIIAVPFMYNEEVLGVFEIASLHPFNQAQLQFLDDATESICVAFHTAHTRAQVDDLLNQTRKQAEELRGQGEELRAINEELEAQAENLRIANQTLKAQAERLRSFEQQGGD